MLSCNNFHKIALLLKFMNVGQIASSFFDQVQSLYCAPEIEKHFMSVISAAREKCKDKEIVVAGQFIFLIIISSQFPEHTDV